MNRNIFLWTLYDFANSIIMIVFLFYFSQWLTVDQGKPDWWFNSSLIIASATFLVAAPFLARKLDVGQKKLSGLRISSVIFTVFYILTAAVVLWIPEQTVLAVILFIIATSIYALSFIYYTPMINDLSDASNRAWVSGIGGAGNYAGLVFGLFAVLPFASHGREYTFLPAIILFILTALPLLIWYKEPAIVVRKESEGVITTIKKIFSIRNLALIFIGYFLFSDALLTFSNNFAIFLEKVYAVSDSTKSYLTASVFILSIFGSIVFGKIADKKGKKKTLIFLLIVWAVLFPCIAFSSSFTMLVVCALISGIFFGPVWYVTRAMVAENTPREIEASSFGFYILAERFATFIGPIIWSLILAGTVSSGTMSYSYAILGMAVLIFISIFFVWKVKED